MPDMNSEHTADEVIRKKLVYRANHRGTKEMDLLVGGFVNKHIGEMSSDDLVELAVILEVPDADIDAWATGKAELPNEYDTKLMAAILSFSYKSGDYS